MTTANERGKSATRQNRATTGRRMDNSHLNRWAAVATIIATVIAVVTFYWQCNDRALVPQRAQELAGDPAELSRVDGKSGFGPTTITLKKAQKHLGPSEFDLLESYSVIGPVFQRGTDEELEVQVRRTYSDGVDVTFWRQGSEIGSWHDGYLGVQGVCLGEEGRLVFVVWHSSGGTCCPGVSRAFLFDPVSERMVDHQWGDRGEKLEELMIGSKPVVNCGYDKVSWPSDSLVTTFKPCDCAVQKRAEIDSFVHNVRSELASQVTGESVSAGLQSGAIHLPALRLVAPEYIEFISKRVGYYGAELPMTMDRLSTGLDQIIALSYNYGLYTRYSVLLVKTASAVEWSVVHAIEGSVDGFCPTSLLGIQNGRFLVKLCISDCGWDCGLGEAILDPRDMVLRLKADSVDKGF